jgi:hypothetical protein
MSGIGYLCVKCGLSIRQNEVAVLKHIRHGQVLGESSGPVDSHGRIIGDSAYRNHSYNNPNSNAEITKSEFELPDSGGFRGKLYKGLPVHWMAYRRIKVSEGTQDLSKEMYDEWVTLPSAFSTIKRSGTEAWHKYCYDSASEEEKSKHEISKSDPYQSMGAPRKKFMCKEKRLGVNYR